MKNVVFRAVQPVFLANVYMCYDHVHLDTLSGVSAYRTVVKPQHTAMQNANPAKDTAENRVYYLYYLNRNMSMTE